MATQILKIEGWMVEGAEASVETFAAAVQLAGADGEWFKISADDQRATLGFNVFGKQDVRVRPEGDGVEVFRSTGFGQDGEQITYPWAIIADSVAKKLKIAPGVSGKGYRD